MAKLAYTEDELFDRFLKKSRYHNGKYQIEFLGKPITDLDTYGLLEKYKSLHVQKDNLFFVTENHYQKYKEENK